MAGEKSKSIGEVGENIAEAFFKKIGWVNPQLNIDFPCFKPAEHVLSSSKGDVKTQHGIDMHVSYKSSLESETLNNLLISVKHSKSSVYPQSATKIFTGYIEDLVHSVLCFQRSSNKQNSIRSHIGVKKANDIPVLFYISSKDEPDADFVSRIQTSRFMNSYDVKELYVVDNKKVSFILDALSFVEQKHADYEWNFFHPQTGMNYGDQSILQHSKTMQIEFLTNSFIPLVLKKPVGENETCKFLIITNEPFSEDMLAKFIHYSRTNTNDNIKDMEISTSDYFFDDHDEIVRKVLNSYDFDINVKVTNFLPTFRSLV